MKGAKFLKIPWQIKIDKLYLILVEIPREPGEAGDDTEIAMRSLGNLVGYEFVEFIMQLADIAFDCDPALCIDPSYNDATVETETRPKHPTGSTTHGPKTREFGATRTHS